MKQPKFILEKGTAIITNARLAPAAGLMVPPQFVNARRAGAKATLGTPVPGHGGDIYWATHEDGATSLYSFEEFELADQPAEVHTPMERGDFAAMAAYDVINIDGVTWADLPEVRKDDWRRVAAKVQEATPAPFFIDLAIKTPAHGPLSHAVHWHFGFGSTDADIEQAGKDFVTRMKAMRDGTL